MTTRRPGARAFRPRPEGLEARKLLAKVISGVDLDGDTWTLRLTGPGDLRVINQNGEDDLPIPLGDPALINRIETAGTAPRQSRLDGSVKKGADGDGRVFFQELTVIGSHGDSNNQIFGIHTIDMPDFWLGYTTATNPTANSIVGSVTSREGVNTLRFGGVDATFTPPGGTPLNQNGLNNAFTVDLGIPLTTGTSVIVDKIISTAQPASGTTAATNDSVVVNVRGRINLFQANAIEGNAAVPSTGFLGGGGTVLRSSQDAGDVDALGTGIIGQIGRVHVGNNATNFSVQSNSQIRNYFVGGETTNVFVLAPTGLRYALFGKGMDTATIRASEVFLLRANRGALNSEVALETRAGQVIIGGDVADTTVLAGYSLDLGDVFTNQTAPSPDPNARPGGRLAQVLIAGNITNSIFAASVQTADGEFAVPDQLELPLGRIDAKVEGTIDNSELTPDEPFMAFYAKNLHLARGPVIPPNVPEPPYPHAGKAPQGPRLAKFLQPNNAGQRQRIAERRVRVSDAAGDETDV